ncbi:hypothetical protein K3392_14005 [Escherichia coli]|nr:hypothetical protein K3392_14005 [Escherichia coli]
MRSWIFIRIYRLQIPGYVKSYLASDGHWREEDVNLINTEVTTDYTNLPKQTFADLIALRQAVVALINLLPEKEKELVKAPLNRTAADFSSYPLTDDLADLPELIAASAIKLTEEIYPPQKSSQNSCE